MGTIGALIHHRKQHAIFSQGIQHVRIGTKPFVGQDGFESIARKTYWEEFLRLHTGLVVHDGDWPPGIRKLSS